MPFDMYASEDSDQPPCNLIRVLLGPLWIAEDQRLFLMGSQDFNQTARMCRLIRALDSVDIKRYISHVAANIII